MTNPGYQDEQPKFTIAGQLKLPTPEKEMRYGIRKADWERLRRKCKNLKSQPGWLQSIGSACIGLAVSAALTIPTILLTEKIPAWIIPSYAAATLAGFAVGICLLLLDYKVMKQLKQDAKELELDMQEVEALLSQVSESVNSGG